MCAINANAAEEPAAVLLPDSEEEFRSLCASAPIGIFLTDPAGCCTYVNARCQSICGFSLAESLGAGWTRFVHHEDRERVLANWAAYMRDGSEYSQEFRFHSPQGPVRWVHVRCGPMRSAGGTLVGHVGTMEDIAERKETEQALRESESKYRLLMEQASDGIHTYDLAGNFIDANSKLCELLGYTRAELLQLNVKDLIPAADLTTAPLLIEELRAGRTIISERLLRRKDGTLLPVEISGKMLPNGVLQAIIRDITERKRAELRLDAQKQALEMVVSGAPLADVLTYLALIVERHTAGRAVASVLLLDEQGRLRNGASPSLPEDYVRAIDGIKADPHVGTCSAAAARRQVVITPDIAADPKWQGLKHLPLALGFQAAWSMPIMARDGRVLGTLGTYFRERRAPAALERQVVEILTRTAALAIERQQTEADLRKSEEWLRAIFDASRDGILVEDNEQIVYVNQAYAALLRYDTTEELIGRHVSVVISPADVERMLGFGRQRAHGELPTSVYEFKGQRKDGTLVDVEASVSTSNIAGHAYITTMLRDITERRQAEAALRQAHAELEQKVAARTAELADINAVLQAEIRERVRAEEARRRLLRQLVTVQEDERRRISQELHDQMGQHLAVIALLINSLKPAREWAAPAKQHFQRLEEAIAQLSQELDRLSWELRPTALDDLGLQTALSNYVAKWSELAQLPVEFQSVGLGEARLAPEIETAIYRIVQEALTNIIKHAQANCVSLILEQRDGHVSAIVEDDGRGFDVEALHAVPGRAYRLGLLGMQERAALVGGTLNIEATVGVGTTIFVRIPNALETNGESHLE